MPRIHTITTDTVITDNDLILGTDGAQGANNATKNFSFGTFKNYLWTSPTIQGNLTVSGGDIILDNNKFLQSKLANGTVIDLIGINGSNVVKIAQDNQPVTFGTGDVNIAGNIVGAQQLTIVSNAVLGGNVQINGNTTLGDAVTDTVTVAGDATFNRDVTITRNLTVNGTINLGDADTDSVVFGADVDSHIIPDDDKAFDLGTSSKQWRELFAKGANFEGDIDVDGIANLDAVDIDGAVQIDGDTKFGVDGTGVDVKFFGDTASRYMMWDQSADTLIFSENAKAQFGTNTADLAIYNDNTNSFVENGTTGGHLYIRNRGDQKDIIFQAEDGENSPSYETYFMLDGELSEAGTAGVNYTRWPDKANIALGDVIGGELHGGEITVYNKHLNISHMISPSQTEKNINITNYSNDGDIKIATDNGSGGTTDYMVFDGGAVQVTNKVHTQFDNTFTVGQDGDGHVVKLYTDSSSRYLSFDPTNDTDGFSKLMFTENVKAQFGTNTADLAIYNNGTDSFVDAGTTAGKLYIRNKGADRDIVFQAWAGTADTNPETYFLLDGSLAEDGSGSQTTNYTRWPQWTSIAMGDVSNNGIEGIQMGSSNGHFNIQHHVGTGTAEKNIAFYNYSPDGDIEFFTNGSGSANSYIRLDGGQEKIFINQDVNPYAIKGATGQPGYLELKADNGANNSDHWKLSAEADNIFEIQTRDGGSYAPVVELVASNKMAYFKGNVDIAGNLSTTGTITGSNLSGTNTGDQDLSGYAPLASPTFTGTVTTGANVIVLAGQNTAAQIELKADAGDNNDDHWKLSAEANATFKVLTRDGGSYNSVVDFVASNKSSLFKGDIHVSGVIENQHFKIPNSIGSAGQVLKVPSSGNTLEWANDTAGTSIPHIVEGTGFTSSLIVGHTTTGTLSNAEANTAVGIGALDAITSGDYNVALGYNAGTALTNTHFNVLIGAKAGEAITTGLSNIAIGYDALGTEDEHGNNVAIGHKALNKLNAGENGLNTAIGFEAGKELVTGIKNTLIGSAAGTAMTTYNENVIIGEDAGKSLTGGVDGVSDHTGSKNVVIGGEAMMNHTSGASNVIIGHGILSGGGGSVGNNVVIGASAGSKVTTGSNSNTIIGWGANLGSNGDDNSIVIGKQAAGHGSHIVVIGNDDITAWHPGDDNGVDLGSTSYSFKDSYVQGRSNAGNFKVDALNSAPAAANSTGSVGEIRYTADYIYICVAENTWKRAALATW